MTAFVFVGMVSCKDNKENETEAMEAMEASDVAINYTVDTDASEITWKGNKPTGSHNGTIDLSSGNFAMNNGAVEAGTFVINMTTITDKDLEGEQKANLEAHLKGTAEGQEGDFFNVNKFGTAKFELTGVSESNGKTMINGNLTIKDKTNAIEFPATISEQGNSVTIKSEPFMIDRTKWGVNYGSKSIFDNLGDKFIDDDMEITVSIVANKA